MLFQRPIFATLALIYCICLGAFALVQNPRSKIHRSFALYNFCNALFNAGDYLFLIPNHIVGVWYTRITSMGAPLMIPFLMSFVFELLGLSVHARYKKIEKTTFLFAGIFALLSLTPLIISDVRYEHLKNPLNTEIPGPLYIPFAVWALISLALVLSALPNAKSNTETHRKRARYVALASILGFGGLLGYFVSLFSVDLPALYYSLQALVAFTFSYAIFKHDLISVNVALRRALLLIGIYIGIAIALAPLVILLKHSLTESISIGPLLLLSIVSGLLFSLGPIAYGRMVRASSIFQDAAASQLVHEFKTPLGAIQSAKEILDTELARKKPNANRIKDYLDMIQRNTERLERFVLEILNTVRAGETEGELKKEFIDMQALITETLTQFPRLRERLSVNITSGLSIQGYQEGLRQVLSNLISNAEKFCPEGSIELRAEKVTEGIEFMLRDHGKGILATDLERIFRPFAQSKEGKNIKKGSGLGLAIAKKWVEAHGGRIWAESDGLGKGARFIFFLPGA